MAHFDIDIGNENEIFSSHWIKKKAKENKTDLTRTFQQLHSLSHLG